MKLFAMAETIIYNKAKMREAPWFRFLRVALGIILIWRGINFVGDTAALQSLFLNSNAGILNVMDAALVVLFAVIIIGSSFLIIIGRFIRMASVFALLVFSIKLLFIHGGYIERSGFELVLLISVLFLLLLFTTKKADSNRTTHISKWNAAKL